MPDRTIHPSISGSEALYDAARKRARALKTTLSGYLDGLIRADLAAALQKVPPPLPPKQNGKRRARSGELRERAPDEA